MSHIPVLLNECLRAFEDIELHSFIDGTLGAGGHSFALLEAHPELQHLIGLDQDVSALKLAKERLEPFSGRFQLFHANFSSLTQVLSYEPHAKFNGILVDLGVSSMQFDQAERGFSLMREGPLDMRMNRIQNLTADEIINTWNEKELINLFFKFGEEKQARRIAKAICQERVLHPFKTTVELSNFIEHLIPHHKKAIHPATLVFQALRIAVNDELGHIERFLPQALNQLDRGGRLAVISFHSLEDRIIKNQFAYYASDKESTSGIGGLFLSKKPEVKILTRKPIIPQDEEIKLNPRSRSAKLRVIEKI